MTERSITEAWAEALAGCDYGAAFNAAMAESAARNQIAAMTDVQYFASAATNAASAKRQALANQPKPKPAIRNRFR